MEENLFLENLNKNKKVIGIIHRAYLTQIKNRRQYLASTKTKSEVRGGGKKPWKQKGTGRARAGSSRSPLWVGGGVTFGPKYRIVSKKINKKENQLAILAALYLKKNKFVFIEEQELNFFTEIKTKSVCKFLSKINIQEKEKILFILETPNKNFWLASRNLKNIEIATVNCLNVDQLLKSDYIVLSKSSLQKINKIYGENRIKS
jgi:large subunit ribosomal protein L4